MKLYDELFNEEVIEFLCQHSIHILTIDPITEGKTFEPSFRLTCPNQIYFAKFSNFGRFSDSFLEELFELNHANEGCLHLPIFSKNFESIKRQLTVYEWLNGNNLKSVLNGAAPKVIAEYGYRCGDLLRKIHVKMKHPSDYCNHIINSFDEYMTRLDQESFAFTNLFDYREFFYRNCDVLLANDKPCFVHMDFKPKNLMLSNGKITVVDIDSSIVGNPWMDFYDKAFSLYPEKETFNAALIHAYFDDNIPDNFWEFFKVLSVYALAQNSACLLRRGDRHNIRLLESYLWNSYNGFNGLIPKWMNVAS